MNGPILLPKEQYRGVKLPVAYETKKHYRVSAGRVAGAYGFLLVPARFRTPRRKAFEMTLYPDYFANAEAYGVFEGETLAAVLEVNRETWNNRLRVTELWVAEPFRRRGIGSSLLSFAKGRGRELACRALVLETQSCNAAAIGLYLENGFSFIGIDTTCYTDHDVEAGEVRLEMGFSIEGDKP